MNNSNKELAMAYAKQELPREACGLIAIVKGRERFFPCKNIGFSPETMFAIDPDDYARVESIGDVVEIFHSHPVTPASPSEADLVSCEKTNLPWVICNPILEKWCEFKPSGYKAPLIGRQWSWGITDCWSLARDWYAENGIMLRDWERPIRPDDFEKDPMFDKCWKDTGFFIVKDEDDIKRGDLVLMQVQGIGLNHIGVYVGGQMLLHHIRGRLSGTDIYGEWLQRCTGKIIRHYNWRVLQLN